MTLIFKEMLLPANVKEILERRWSRKRNTVMKWKQRVYIFRCQGGGK